MLVIDGIIGRIEKILLFPPAAILLPHEFKGKINDSEFLVYINAETGDEEDILIVYNTPNGVLTM